jgi:hypothetical protein
LKILKFAGPNDATISDMMTIAHLHRLEVLNVDQQAVFADETLKLLGTECLNLRTLSCAACYGVSDVGISCLSSCRQLCDLNTSYCDMVTDQGLSKLLHGDMKRLCVRACHFITDSGIGQVAGVCLQLQELDVSGCPSISNQSLCSLQESILHLRTPQHRSFTLLAGGSCIESEALLKFAAATGATVQLYDLSIPTLSADYDPDLFIAPLGPSDEEEDWEGAPLPTDSDTLPTEQPEPYLFVEDSTSPHMDDHDRRDYLLERAEDFLVADDPAMYSDEFSGPEEWGLG